MKREFHALLALVMVGCSGTEAVSRSGDAEEEVRVLSRAAVEEADTGPDLVPIRVESTAADYGDPVLAESVPMADAADATAGTEEAVAEGAEPVEHAVFTLRRGETLAHYARWSGSTVEDIAAASGLDLGGIYPVGTEVRVPADVEEAASIETAREAHHARRVEAYLDSRGGQVGEEVYTVRTGDSAWTIARHQSGLPVWVVEQYNPGVAMDALRPGDTLRLPVVADVVVDAE